MVSTTSQPILYDNQVTLARPMSPRYHQAVLSPNSSLSVSGLDDWGNPTNQESCHIPHCQPQPRWTLTVAMSGTWPLQHHRTDADINTFPILVVSRYFSRPWQNLLKQHYNPHHRWVDLAALQTLSSSPARQQRMIMPPLLLTDYTQPPPKLILTSSSQRHSPWPFQDCIHLLKHLITSTQESTMWEDAWPSSITLYETSSPSWTSNDLLPNSSSWTGGPHWGGISYGHLCMTHGIVDWSARTSIVGGKIAAWQETNTRQWWGMPNLLMVMPFWLMLARTCVRNRILAISYGVWSHYLIHIFLRTEHFLPPLFHTEYHPNPTLQPDVSIRTLFNCKINLLLSEWQAGAAGNPMGWQILVPMMLERVKSRVVVTQSIPITM